ncbi:PepSY-associated TM helix domain-containing protein [Persicirhabdus sediminis]|uniref:PepSY domain-containing protein n=1 Tax=Persicirhabdus sediminis TaxID=454144 RepID=A0A8J7MCV6_9BACT|nr:PepSY-associated TM helix domain-containing protein [Persicirhabdus sediminis]MBK1791012.1 PepSY domain-containing protein [Persicirhabdus sediminis]
MMKSKFFKWHRKIALLMAVPVILWSFSGLLHPLMANWFRAEIQNPFIKPHALDVPPHAKPVAEIAEAAGIAELRQLRIVELDDIHCYQLIDRNDKQWYFGVLTGIEINDGQNSYARQLACSYSGQPAENIVSAELVEDFTLTYRYINRLLPVWKVVFENGQHVYVDTATSKLATHDTPAKRLYLLVFSYTHTWSFLGDESSWLRIIIVALCSVLSLFVGVSGIVTRVFFKNRTSSGQTRKLGLSRKLHRSLGIIISLFYLMFSFSAIWQIAAKTRFDRSFLRASERTVPTIQLESHIQPVIDQLKAQGKLASQISLASNANSSYYRVQLLDRQNPAASVYVNTMTGELTDYSDADYARELAGEFSQYPAESISDCRLITRFARDYGFIYKRLPVWRISYRGEEYQQYTVDTVNSHLSMRSKPAQVVDALIFINLHKLHFLDVISKDTRDVVSILSALMIILVSITGLVMMRRKKVR